MVLLSATCCRRSSREREVFCCCSFLIYTYVLRPSLFYCTNKFGLFGDRFVGWSFTLFLCDGWFQFNQHLHAPASVFIRLNISLWASYFKRYSFFYVILIRMSCLFFLCIFEHMANMCVVVSVRFPVNAGKVYHYKKKKKETKETKRQPY